MLVYISIFTFDGACLQGQQSPNFTVFCTIYSVDVIVTTWIATYALPKDGNKCGLNEFESCDTGEVLYELSDYSNIADH